MLMEPMSMEKHNKDEKAYDPSHIYNSKSFSLFFVTFTTLGDIKTAKLQTVHTVQQ